MQGNPKVLDTLQAAAAMESHLNQQYRLDTRSLKFAGIKKVAKKTDKYGDDTHSFLKKVSNRILFLGGSPSYDAGTVTEQKNLTVLLQNELALEMAIVAPYEQAVETAMDALDDTTRNLFEHLLKWHEDHVAWIERQLRLITALTEPGYIAEQL